MITRPGVFQSWLAFGAGVSIWFTIIVASWLVLIFVGVVGFKVAEWLLS